MTVCVVIIGCYPEVSYSMIPCVEKAVTPVSFHCVEFMCGCLTERESVRVRVCVCMWLCHVPSTVFRGALERLMCWRVLAVTLKRAWAVAVCFFLPPGPHNLSLCVPGRTTPGTVYILGAQWNTKTGLCLVFKVHFSCFVCFSLLCSNKTNCMLYIKAGQYDLKIRSH